MTSPIAVARNAFHRIALGRPQVARTVLRVAAKGAFLAVMALMIVAYAVSASQSAPPPPEPLPDFIYS